MKPKPLTVWCVVDQKGKPIKDTISFTRSGSIRKEIQRSLFTTWDILKRHWGYTCKKYTLTEAK
jgi:hypothetical protein